MRRRKQSRRATSRRLALEPLGSRMVLSVAGPLALAFEPQALAIDARAVRSQAVDRLGDVGPLRFGDRLAAETLVHHQAGPRGPRDDGWFGGWRGSAAPAVFTTDVFVPLSLWIVVVVDPPVAPQLPLTTLETPLARPSHNGLGPSLPPLAAILGGLAPRPAVAASAQATQSPPVGGALAPSPWWAGASPTSQPAERVAASWTTIPQNDPTQRQHTAPAPHGLLVPDTAHDGEGGLVELETPDAAHRPGDEATRAARKRRSAIESLQALDWVWAELGAALAAADRQVPQQPEPRPAIPPQALALDGEGGLIALAVDNRAVPAPLPGVPALPRDAVDPAVEAGLALFQAFELGDAPGERGDGNLGEQIGASTTGATSQENAAVDDSGEPLKHRAAIGAAAIATLPIAIRRRQVEDDRANVEAGLRRLRVTRLR